jgi:hypothetical protein
MSNILGQDSILIPNYLRDPSLLRKGWVVEIIKIGKEYFLD